MGMRCLWARWRRDWCETASRLVLAEVVQGLLLEVGPTVGIRLRPEFVSTRQEVCPSCLFKVEPEPNRPCGSVEWVRLSVSARELDVAAWYLHVLRSHHQHPKQPRPQHSRDMRVARPARQSGIEHLSLINGLNAAVANAEGRGLAGGDHVLAASVASAVKEHTPLTNNVGDSRLEFEWESNQHCWSGEYTGHTMTFPRARSAQSRDCGFSGKRRGGSKRLLR